ncbi:MAG: hypothetical protein ACM359_19645 [Bacillota bacterium]
MMVRDIASRISVAAVPAASALIYKLLVSPSIDLSDNLAVFISTMGGVLLSLFLDWLLDVPMTFASLRPIWDARARVEGLWFEVIGSNADCVYSVCCIEFNKASRKFTMGGRAYSGDGHLESEWKSDDVTIKCSGHGIELVYMYKACYRDGHRSAAEGTGSAQISRNTSTGRYLTGTGSYIDTERRNGPTGYRMQRLEPALLHRYIGKQSLETIEDEELFARKYHEARAADVRRKAA